MKILLILLGFCVNLYAGIIELEKNEVQKIIEQREKFFTKAFTLCFDKAKISLDIHIKQPFIDLCKYPIKDGYEFPCGKIGNEEVGIRKYFIKARNIQEAYKIFENKNQPIRKNINFYDYGEAENNRIDKIGSYYIWDNNGRFWVIDMGYDSGSIRIYTQKQDYIEVIYQWSVDW